MSPPNLPCWDNIKTVEIFEERFKVKTAIQNDANACALAEWKFGAGVGTNSMIFLTFGTGILDRVTVRNITGIYRSYGFFIDPWFDDNTLGNMKNIFIENVDLKVNKNTYNYRPLFCFLLAEILKLLPLKI